MMMITRSRRRIQYDMWKMQFIQLEAYEAHRFWREEVIILFPVQDCLH